MGREGGNTNLAVYRTGKVRLPADYSCDEVIVECRRPRTLVIRPAREGEIGVNPYLSRASKSAQIRPIRAFRRLGIDPKVAAGTYDPVRRGDALEVELNAEEGNGTGSTGV